MDSTVTDRMSRRLDSSLAAAANRRVANRFDHSSKVLFRATSSTFRACTSCDFSPRGARLKMPESIPAGSPVALNLCLQESNSSTARFLSVQATVVWTKRSGKGAEIGVAFNGGCPADVKCLHVWLHSQMMTRRLK